MGNIVFINGNNPVSNLHWSFPINKDIQIQYILGSYRTVVVKFVKWQQKLFGIACEHTWYHRTCGTIGLDYNCEPSTKKSWKTYLITQRSKSSVMKTPLHLPYTFIFWLIGSSLTHFLFKYFDKKRGNLLIRGNFHLRSQKLFTISLLEN